HGQRVRLARVQHAVQHGPPRLHVENVREPLGVVAGHDDLPALDLVKYALLAQQALGESGVWQRDKSVELRVIPRPAAHAPRYHDPVGADVETDRLSAVQFGVVHDTIPWPTLLLERKHLFAVDAFVILP